MWVFFWLKIILVVTFIQKKHWEFVQGEFNPFKLSHSVFLNIDVGCLSSWFFTRNWLVRIISKYPDKNYSENIQKLKKNQAGTQKCTSLEKNSRFGHTSFIKVVINGTIATNSNAIPHEGSSQAQYLCMAAKCLQWLF